MQLIAKLSDITGDKYISSKCVPTVKLVILL